jgi:Ca2+-binding EF-hand superfamily protein
MENDNLMQILHDRATRGEVLSETERRQLESWYESQDKLESESLNKIDVGNILSKRNIQIESALSEIAEITSKIQKILAENEKIRRENEILRRKIAENLALEII